jgi:hypothetical protein
MYADFTVVVAAIGATKEKSNLPLSIHYFQVMVLRGILLNNCRAIFAHRSDYFACLDRSASGNGGERN